MSASPSSAVSPQPENSPKTDPLRFFAARYLALVADHAAATAAVERVRELLAATERKAADDLDYRLLALALRGDGVNIGTREVLRALDGAELTGEGVTR